MGNQDSRTENVTLQKMQSNKDPFRYAWFFSIPETTPSKAIYEFYRYQNRWSPYKWNGLNLSPSFPQNTPAELFDLINRSCKPHPLPTYKKKFLIYLLAFHLPITILGMFLTIYFSIREKQYATAVALTYIIGVVVMTFGLVTAAIYSKLKYSSALEERVKSLENLISDLNNSRYLARGFRFAVGEHGAWIELQFLDRGLMMVRGGHAGGQNRVAPAGGFIQSGGAGVNNLAKPLDRDQGDGYNPF